MTGWLLPFFKKLGYPLDIYEKSRSEIGLSPLWVLCGRPHSLSAANFSGPSLSLWTLLMLKAMSLWLTPPAFLLLSTFYALFSSLMLSTFAPLASYVCLPQGPFFFNCPFCDLPALSPVLNGLLPRTVSCPPALVPLLPVISLSTMTDKPSGSTPCINTPIAC